MFARRNQTTLQAFQSGVSEVLPMLPITRFAQYLARKSRRVVGAVEEQEEQEQEQQSLADSNYIHQVVDRYVENKRLIEAVADAHSTKAVFVWQPVPMYQYALEHHPFAEGGFMPINRYAADGYAYMAEVAETTDLGDDFLWCADIQRSLREPLYVDQIHYSSRMNRIVSTTIVDLLVERELVPFQNIGEI